MLCTFSCSPLHCKHITLKTALKPQQMSNLRVNYHYGPLTSVLTTLWLWAGAAVRWCFMFFQHQSSGSPNSLIGPMSPHQAVMWRRGLWSFQYLWEQNSKCWRVTAFRAILQWSLGTVQAKLLPDRAELQKVQTSLSVRLLSSCLFSLSPAEEVSVSLSLSLCSSLTDGSVTLAPRD